MDRAGPGSDGEEKSRDGEFSSRNGETDDQMVSKLQEELEKIRAQNQQLEAQMRTRELEAKQKLESMRTQAVFSVSSCRLRAGDLTPQNHNAMASASKARHQSQWSSSQRPGAPTPLRASPLKEKTMRTPAPLTRSVTKAKGELSGTRRRADMQTGHHRLSSGSYRMHSRGPQRPLGRGSERRRL